MRQEIDIKKIDYNKKINFFYGSYQKFPFNSGNLSIIGKRETKNFKRIDHGEFDHETLKSMFDNNIGYQYIYSDYYIWVSDCRKYFIFLYYILKGNS